MQPTSLAAAPLPTQLPALPPQLPQQISLSQQVEQKRTSAEKSQTFNAVKTMIEQMVAQISAATADEDKHKQWCDTEITTNSAVIEEKETKLKRLHTRIDNEKETTKELGENLMDLDKEGQVLEAELKSYAQVSHSFKNFFTASAQNHQIAAQILQQAVMILRRYESLDNEMSAPQVSQGAFLQKATKTISEASTDRLSGTQLKYQQLQQLGDSRLFRNCGDFTRARFVFKNPSPPASG